MSIINSCGKEVYKVSDVNFLKRFLILGCENGTYYIGKNDLTFKNLSCIERLITSSDPSVIVNVAREYMSKVYKKDYILYVLARCCASSIMNLRESAYELASEICKIPTHLFMFIEYCEACNKLFNGSTGWNRIHKKMITDWYLDKNIMKLVYLVTKYKNRNNWTHADVLKLTHITPPNSDFDCLFAYIIRGFPSLIKKPHDDANIDLLTYINDYEELKSYTKDNITQAIELIAKHNFVREHVPTNLLNNADIWNALLKNMPLIALMRNLNKITSIGVFDTYEGTLENIVNSLKNKDLIKNSKVHPLQILITLNTYSSGKGQKGALTWKPVEELVDALNIAFKLSFVNVIPTNKRILIGLDISGSMTGHSVCGINSMTSSEISVAMCMILCGIEPNCDIMGFSDTFKKIDISAGMSLQSNLATIYNNTFGSTDISIPFRWSLENNKEYDAFIIFTDCETNTNKIKPSVALQNYRKEMNLPNSKLIVVAMASNNFTIADPDDFGMLDIGGFDAETPTIIRDFIV